MVYYLSKPDFSTNSQRNRSPMLKISRQSEPQTWIFTTFEAKKQSFLFLEESEQRQFRLQVLLRNNETVYTLAPPQLCAHLRNNETAYTTCLHGSWHMTKSNFPFEKSYHNKGESNTDRKAFKKEKENKHTIAMIPSATWHWFLT